MRELWVSNPRIKCRFLIKSRHHKNIYFEEEYHMFTSSFHWKVEPLTSSMFDHMI